MWLVTRVSKKYNCMRKHLVRLRYCDCYLKIIYDVASHYLNEGKVYIKIPLKCFYTMHPIRFRLIVNHTERALRDWSHWSSSNFFCVSLQSSYRWICWALSVRLVLGEYPIDDKSTLLMTWCREKWRESNMKRTIFLLTHGCRIVHKPDSKVHGTNMGPSGADRTQVGPMLAPWTLLSGN